MAIEPNSTTGDNSSKKASVNDLRERERERERAFLKLTGLRCVFFFLRKRLRAECSAWKDLQGTQ